MTDCVSQLDRQAELGSGLSLREEVATGVDCRDFVVGGPTSASLSSADGCEDFAGDCAVSVTSPAVFAGVVTVGVASLADAEVVSSAILFAHINRMAPVMETDSGPDSPARVTLVKRQNHTGLCFWLIFPRKVLWFCVGILHRKWP